VTAIYPMVTKPAGTFRRAPTRWRRPGTNAIKVWK
jgi:hypothetical protein